MGGEAPKGHVYDGDVGGRTGVGGGECVLVDGLAVQPGCAVVDRVPGTDHGGGKTGLEQVSEAIQVGGATAPLPLKLGDIASKHDFPNVPLKMVRAIQRGWASERRLAVGAEANWATQEQPLELGQHVFDRNVAAQECQHLSLQGVERHGLVDLFGVLRGGARRGQVRGTRCREHGLQIFLTCL